MVEFLFGVLVGLISMMGVFGYAFWVILGQLSRATRREDDIRTIEDTQDDIRKDEERNEP